MEKALSCPLSVLVVDDDQDFREAISDLLGHVGHRAETVGTAREASRCLVEDSFDLILLDVRMPEMDGMDFLSHMQQYGCTVPVVIMTGSQTPGVMARAISLGVWGVLGKPFRTEELRAEVERVARCLARRARSGA